MQQGILWAVIAQPISVPRRFPTGQPHHITLAFGASLDDWRHLVGRQFQATAIAEAWNERIQSLQVSLPDWVPCQNAHPHISVSWAEGITPVASNAMLECVHESRSVTLVLDCRIEFHLWR